VRPTKALAIACAPDRIRVNAAVLGRNAMRLASALQQDQACNSAGLERTRLERSGEPEEIAGPVGVLHTPAAAFIAGCMPPVDSGCPIA
jgi:NAD(P)-dependent dehydrogenase (short-subunit alcohol dehydrogenase family)